MIQLSSSTRALNHAFVEAFVELDTRAAFGLMGEDTAGLIAALVEPGGIPFFGFRHESAALMAAHGYGWASGELGVCVLSRGPGATNAATAAVTAAKAGGPVLVITGDGDVEAGPGPDLKAFDHGAFAATVGLAHFTARDAEGALRALADAVVTARAGRPALLTIPTDLFGSPCDAVPAQLTPPPVAPSLLPSDGEIAGAAELLAASRRPLILAGGGAVASGARDVLQRLAERSGALLGTSLLAKDLFRGHPLDLGMVGGFASDAGRRILDEVDFVLVAGASLNSFTTAFHNLFRDVPIVQIDADAAAINANFPVRLGIVGDARQTAERILAAVPARDGGHAPAALADPFDAFEDATTADELDPRALALALGPLLPPSTTVVVDGGHHLAFTGMYTRFGGPDRYRLTTEFASVGLGLGTAIGAAVARRGSPVVLQIGDGGLMMSLGDLETVTRCEIPLVILVMNDRAYGAERHFMDLMGAPHELSMFPEVDIAGLGRTLGIESATIRSLDELRAYAPTFAGRTAPLLLDCRIAPQVRAAWFDEL